MGINERIADRITEHVFDLDEAAGEASKKVSNIFNELEKDVAREVKTFRRDATGAISMKQRRTILFLDQIRRMMNKSYTKSSNRFAREIEKQVRKEVAFTNDLINTEVGVDISTVQLSPDIVKRIATTKDIEGAPASEWWAKQDTTLFRTFKRGIQKDFARGVTTDKTIKWVSEMMETPKYRAEALARTAFNKASNDTRMAIMERNGDLIKGYIQVSHLDDRTTDICIKYNGATWDNEFRPTGTNKLPFANGCPRHWNCRSVISPVLYSWEELAGKRFGKQTFTGKLKELFMKRGVKPGNVESAIQATKDRFAELPDGKEVIKSIANRMFEYTSKQAKRAVKSVVKRQVHKLARAGEARMRDYLKTYGINGGYLDEAMDAAHAQLMDSLFVTGHLPDALLSAAKKVVGGAVKQKIKNVAPAAFSELRKQHGVGSDELDQTFDRALTVVLDRNYENATISENAKETLIAGAKATVSNIAYNYLKTNGKTRLRRLLKKHELSSAGLTGAIDSAINAMEGEFVGDLSTIGAGAKAFAGSIARKKAIEAISNGLNRIGVGGGDVKRAIGRALDSQFDIERDWRKGSTYLEFGKDLSMQMAIDVGRSLVSNKAADLVAQGLSYVGVDGEEVRAVVKRTFREAKNMGVTYQELPEAFVGIAKQFGLNLTENVAGAIVKGVVRQGLNQAAIGANEYFEAGIDEGSIADVVDDATTRQLKLSTARKFADDVARTAWDVLASEDIRTSLRDSLRAHLKEIGLKGISVTSAIDRVLDDVLNREMTVQGLPKAGLDFVTKFPVEVAQSFAISKARKLTRDGMRAIGVYGPNPQLNKKLDYAVERALWGAAKRREGMELAEYPGLLAETVLDLGTEITKAYTRDAVQRGASEAFRFLEETAKEAVAEKNLTAARGALERGFRSIKDATINTTETVMRLPRDASDAIEAMAKASKQKATNLAAATRAMGSDAAAKGQELVNGIASYTADTFKKFNAALSGEEIDDSGLVVERLSTVVRERTTLSADAAHKTAQEHIDAGGKELKDAIDLWTHGYFKQMTAIQTSGADTPKKALDALWDYKIKETIADRDARGILASAIEEGHAKTERDAAIWYIKQGYAGQKPSLAKATEYLLAVSTADKFLAEHHAAPEGKLYRGMYMSVPDWNSFIGGAKKDGINLDRHTFWSTDKDKAAEFSTGEAGTGYEGTGKGIEVLVEVENNTQGVSLGTTEYKEVMVPKGVNYEFVSGKKVTVGGKDRMIVTVREKPMPQIGKAIAEQEQPVVDVAEPIPAPAQAPQETKAATTAFDAVLAEKTFVKPKGYKGDVTWVNTAAFEEGFKKNKEQHIGPGGEGENAIKGRYERFEEFLAENDRIETPVVSISKGLLSAPEGAAQFVDGRHRYAVLRDKGATAIPVHIESGDGEFAYTVDELKAKGIVVDGPKPVSPVKAPEPEPVKAPAKKKKEPSYTVTTPDLHEKAQEWQDNLPKEQQNAVSSWFGGKFEEIKIAHQNQDDSVADLALKLGKSVTEKKAERYRKDAAALTAALADPNAIRPKGRVYRGTAFDTSESFEKFIAKFTVGGTVSQPGFEAYSTDKIIADKFAYRTLLRPGDPKPEISGGLPEYTVITTIENNRSGVAIGNVDESEVLVPGGVGYKVVDVDVQKHESATFVNIKLREIVPKNDQPE